MKSDSMLENEYCKRKKTKITKKTSKVNGIGQIRFENGISCRNKWMVNVILLEKVSSK